MVSLLASTAIAALVLYGLYQLGTTVIRRLRSPLRALRGPPSPSLFVGVEFQLIESEEGVLLDQWAQEYGTSYSYPSFASEKTLASLDPRAIGHILSNSDIYPKPDVVRALLGELLGDGLIIAEGETHKRQRRILNPCFSPAQIRDITPIFFQKAEELRDTWNVLLQKAPEPDAGLRMDACLWMGRVTLDIIGLAGFGYSFDSLRSDDEELAVAFREMLKAHLESRVSNILRAFYPWLRPFIPEKDRVMKRRSMETMRRIGLDLIGKKKAEALHILHSEKREKALGKANFGRDLLSTLIRANMAPDLSPAHRLSDEEVLNQITTFMLAGHETTSNSVIWALYVLSKNIAVQTKLRDEVLMVMEETPSMDDLNALPYLELFVREVLRLHAPVRDTIRTATKDDTIPLSDPIVDVNGNTLHAIRVQAGDDIIVPIIAMNRSKVLWGEDAHEFKPERFENLPSAAASIPGVWAHTLTFLGGTRACIGYRFSVIEMKAILFTLVRSFMFEPADPSIIIDKKSAIVTRPIVRGQEDKGPQLPLLVKPVVHTR